VTITGDLVDILVSTKLKDIPEEAQEIARQVCLDGIGVMIAGAGEPLGLGRIAFEYTKQLGGEPTSSVICGGFKSNALNTAYANGCLAHALDFDNTWWPLNHPTSPTLPAILAIAERDGLSGADITRAIVLSFEVQGRMRVASASIDAGTGFHKPGVSGLMGAVTASGILLDLDEDQFMRAFGLGGSRAGSISTNTGTMTKSSHSGHAARMGVECATLAKLGWTANKDMFGAGGFFELFYGKDHVEIDLFLKGFADPYRMIEPGVGFKKHPANYFTHRPIDASIELANKHDLKPDNIDSVTVDFPTFSYVNRPQPETGLDGKFSVQYATTVALLDRKVKVATFSDKRRFAPDVVDLLPRVTLNMRDDIPRSFQDCYAIVTVKTKDGQELVERCDKPRGIWGIPLSRDERLAKFRDCCELALPSEHTERVIEIVEGLEGLDNITELMNIVREGKAITPEWNG
jgi:2-methylcitrate dehydratase PrpD